MSRAHLIAITVTALSFVSTGCVAIHAARLRDGQNTPWRQRVESAIALADLHEEAAAKALIRATDDSEAEIRFHAIESLEEIMVAFPRLNGTARPEVCEALIRRLSDAQISNVGGKPPPFTLIWPSRTQGPIRYRAAMALCAIFRKDLGLDAEAWRTELKANPNPD